MLEKLPPGWFLYTSRPRAL